MQPLIFQMMDLETFLTLYTGKSLKRLSPTQGCSTNGRRRKCMGKCHTWGKMLREYDFE